MGIIYDLINKGITDSEISTCYKEMRLLAERISCLLNVDEILGLSISLSNNNYIVKVRKSLSEKLIIFFYNKDNGKLYPESGFDNILSATIFCKSVKGQLYNTTRILSTLKHQQLSITLKHGNDCNAYVYGLNLVLTIPKFKEPSNIKFDKFVVKENSKIQDYIDLSI